MTDAPAPLLEVRDLHVYYGHAHALQGVSLSLDHGILSVVGRNGMGKTTLCNTIMGLVPAAGGSITVAGREILGLPSNRIVQRGLGYVPQGRRVWPSLTVDEHLRVARRGGDGAWTLDRVYDTFPALGERRRHGGAQLSGGEQQMLAIGRALLANPRLLIMDEPTEGLAPIIVDQVALMLKRLADEGEISVLLIEQNLGVATDVSDRIAVMVNGRIARDMGARELAADEELQQRLLGVGAQEEEPEARPELDIPAAGDAPAPAPVAQVFRVRRQAASEDAVPGAPPPVYTAAAAPTAWSQGNPLAARAPADAAAPGEPERAAATADRPAAAIAPIPAAAGAGGVAYIAGTFDTKGRELTYLQSCIDRLGVRSVTVDLSTSQAPSPADVGPAEVARHHPKGAAAVFTGDRGSAVAAMAEAFARFITTRRDLGGLISAGGSGATALATPAMRALQVGVPKVMVSTVASGNVRAYVGPADICMMYSVTDVSGINSISERVLANAAHALAGMIGYRRPARAEAKPAIGLTMFGVTTPCVQAVARALEADYDCLTFHATGTGGQSMEKLVDSGLLAGVVDITTTEVCDLLMGGVFSAGEDRLGAIIRTRVPYVGSCGALDMVNWGPMDTVPERFRDRNLYVHNPQVTLMRTTADENERLGRWIGERLNRMEGPARFLLPEGGVSLLDAPGMAFHDPATDRALFAALEATVRQTADRQLVRLPHNLNDPEFANALVTAFREVMAGPGGEHAEIPARRAS